MEVAIEIAKSLWGRLGAWKVPIVNLELEVVREIAWEKIKEPASQRKLILVIVSIALLLDNMLYMVIVPIIPDYLRYMNSDGEVNLTKPSKPIPRAHHGEDSATGILFASKAIVQLMINPFSGSLIDRIGYDIPMMIGLTIMFFSTAVFACGTSYSVLFFARSLQGVGSAFADTSGLAMIADRFTEESERSKALGIALAFISFGCLVAPPFGGALYQFSGKEIPFLILAFVCLLDGIMLLLVMKPMNQQLGGEQKQRETGPTTPIWRLFMDPYIAVCSGALMMSNVALAFLEPTISLWMEDNITTDSWKIGMIWLPAFFPHVFGVILTVKMAKKYMNYQWLMVALGLALEGMCCFIIPFSTSYQMLMIPICGICFGIALVDTAILPTLGYIVDVRYVSVYGSIYAIADISYSLAYAIGPIIAGGIVEAIGFTWLNILIAFSNLLYAPVLYRLRNIYDFKPFQSEANILMSNPPDKEYQTYMLQERNVAEYESLREEDGPTTTEWHANWTSLSVWFRSTLSEERKSEANFSTDYTAYDRVNTDLPKLPVPELQHTLTRYLEALQPILPEKQFIRTKRIVDEFGAEGGDGDRIQRGLRKRREDFHNWAYDWWLDDMYLNNPIALPINSNPGMVFPPRKFSSPPDMAKFAARLISSALIFKGRIDSHDLPVESVVTNGVSQQLCMAQYGRIFTSYRAPGVLKDSLLRVGTDFEVPDPHVIIVCREQFYKIHLLKEDRELLSENEIATRLAYILNESRRNKMTDYPIGLMTSMKRDWWGAIRDQLQEDSGNRENMLAIETSMLIICFDMGDMPSSFNHKSKHEGGRFNTLARDETSMMHQMIHGGGSTANSGNRWFDKTIQLIISKDGVNGLCYEHSAAEGVAVINAMESMLHACDNLNNIIIDPSLKVEDLKPMTWNVTSDLDREICFARETIDESVQDLDFNVFRFDGYGKNFIKKYRCSPDAFVQLALQLAYFRLHGTLCATYESASTRRFRFGRVDCIRAETMEVLRWVSSMDSTISERQFPLDEKLELFDVALLKQTLITTENITGHGIDVHLLGLRQMAKDCKVYAEIFEDETYALANQFLLSTSQVATKIDGFMGYGPVVPNGYGASYNPKDDSIIFCISSFQSSPITSTAEFTQSLADSLNAMKNLAVNRK